MLVTDESQLSPAVDIVSATIREIDETCSAFRPDSEITLLNDSPATVRSVTPPLLRAIQVALAGAAATGGLADPTVGTVTLPERGPRSATDDPIRVTSSRPASWREVIVDPVAGTVTRPAGVRLDLGASAKAWCADLAAGRAAAATGAGVLVNLCGDIAVAGPAPAEGWDILVADDHRWTGAESHDAVRPGARVSIASGGVATSSTAVRGRRSAGGQGRVAHLVDPRTHIPVAGPYRTVTVAAATCAEANAAATAALVRGADARVWLDRGHVPARLVAEDDSVHVSGGWPT